MKINESNRKAYEDAFILNGEYCVDTAGWKPSINENEISEMCGDEEGHWYPATPLGYRDYKISRVEGLKNIFSQDCSVELTLEDAHQIKKDEEPFRQYDKIKIDDNYYVITGNDDVRFYVVNEDNLQYYIDYLTEK